MQRGQVDMCIVGTDRTLSNGDVCNKIGTYLKALSAKDNNVPFYVALPSSTIDWTIKITRKFLSKREILRNYLMLRELMKIMKLKKLEFIHKKPSL